MTIYASLRSFAARKPSTDNAVAGFTKALDELNAVVEMEQSDIDAIDAEVAALYDDKKDAVARRDRASSIAAKFKDLIG